MNKGVEVAKRKFRRCGFLLITLGLIVMVFDIMLILCGLSYVASLGLIMDMMVISVGIVELLGAEELAKREKWLMERRQKKVTGLASWLADPTKFWIFVISVSLFGIFVIILIQHLL